MSLLPCRIACWRTLVIGAEVACLGGVCGCQESSPCVQGLVTIDGDQLASGLSTLVNASDTNKRLGAAVEIGRFRSD
ncbi:MAG: hypothetical protein KDA37_12515 [Planctomycetales bacterium]|nr:hypothetical protein [Planctomycetales bacterium]